MKKVAVVLALLTAVLQVAAAKRDPAYRDARRNGALAKIELHVADDEGTPVGEAEVKVFLGMNFRPKGRWVKGMTDTNGVFVAEGRTCGDEIEVFVTKAGYYDSRVKYCYAPMGAEHEVSDGKWQPYGAEETIELRMIKHPLALSLSGDFSYTKRLNEWIGYDIETHDFVAPHGAGKNTDFEVSIDWNGDWYPDYKGMGVRLRFTEPYSGYYFSTMHGSSVFKGPYAADPQGDYLKEARFYEEKTGDGQALRHRFDKDNCWVVRSRCKVDKDGRLLAANYSIVYLVSFCGTPYKSGGIRVFGAFNPTPNDTNLEPKREGAR